MHSLQHLKQRLMLKCPLLMLATESLICRCLCSFCIFFCSASTSFYLAGCQRRETAVHLYLDQRERGTATLPVWYTLYISEAHTLLGKCEKKTIWWKEKKTNMYNSSVSSLSAMLMETEHQRWSLHFQRVLVCSHTGWHWDGARWSVNSRVINKPTVHHRDVRGRRGRTQGWEEGGAPTRKLCLIRLIQRAGRPAGPASFLHKVLHQLSFC